MEETSLLQQQHTLRRVLFRPNLGLEIKQMMSPEFARIVKRKDALDGQVIHIDDFGNIITCFTEKELEKQRKPKVS